MLLIMEFYGIQLINALSSLCKCTNVYWYSKYDLITLIDSKLNDIQTDSAHANYILTTVHVHI